MNATVAESHTLHNNNIVGREPERQLNLPTGPSAILQGGGGKPFFALVRDTRVPGNATTYAVWMQIGQRCQSEDHWWAMSLDEIADGARCSPRSVSTHTKLLEESGLLEVRHHHNGRKNLYRVHAQAQQLLLSSSATPAEQLGNSCDRIEEREQLRGSSSSGSETSSEGGTNIGAATPPQQRVGKSGSTRSRISFSKQTLLFLKLYRKLSKGRGEKIDEDGLRDKAQTFEGEVYAEKKAILDRLIAEERLLAAKGEVSRTPPALGGPGAVRRRPSPNGDVVQIVGSVAKSMPETSDDFGERAPKIPWKYEARDQRPRRTTPDCAEHVFSEPAGDGIETCVLCLRERGTIHPVKED